MLYWQSAGNGASEAFVSLMAVCAYELHLDEGRTDANVRAACSLPYLRIRD